MSEIQLRYGMIAGLYYDIRKIKTPKQLDLIDTWFPDLIIRTDPSDGTTKIPARYEDREFMIHAVRYRGHLYCGGSTRVSQIEGRLIGSAAGNREKERRSAELIFYSSDGVNLISAALAEKGSSKYVLLEAENTSNDELLRFCVGSFAVNNLVISSSDWDSVTINPSGRAIITLDIDSMLDEEEYEQFGIGEIDEAAFHVDIVNADGDYLAEDDSVSIDFEENNEDNAAADDAGEEIYSAGGIRIISKGTSKDSYDFNLLLMIDNDSDETIYVSNEYGSTSVNGFMADASMYGQEIEPGQAGGLKYQIDMDSLNANNISISDITTVAFQLNIGSGNYYNYIDQPRLTIEYKK